MQYLAARLEQWADDRLYRVYMADCAKACTANTAAYCNGMVMQARFADLLDRKAPAVQKSGDEIAAEVIQKAGLKVVRKDNERI